MEAICCSETSVDTQRTTWRYIPEDGTLYRAKILEGMGICRTWERLEVHSEYLGTLRWVYDIQVGLQEVGCEDMKSLNWLFLLPNIIILIRRRRTWVSIRIKNKVSLFWDITTFVSGASQPTFRRNVSTPSSGSIKFCCAYYWYCHV
jgi:hypothetical protein